MAEAKDVEALSESEARAELARLAALVPKTSVATNYTTSAFKRCRIKTKYLFKQHFEFNQIGGDCLGGAACRKADVSG